MKWSKKRLKQELKKAYAPPDPVRKEGFLGGLGCGRPTAYISMWKFMWEQLLYIKKWVWAVSAGILVLAVYSSRNLDRDSVWMLSAAMPFLALTVLAESGRSSACGMDELEFATRFSMRSLMLVRMGALAAAHSIVIAVALVCLRTFGAFDVSETLKQAEPVFFGRAPYITIPYLLTVCIGFWLLREYRGRETSYICVGASVFVSAAAGVLGKLGQFIYGIGESWWILLSFVILVGAVREALLFYRQTEELSWY